MGPWTTSFARLALAALAVAVGSVGSGVRADGPPPAALPSRSVDNLDSAPPLAAFAARVVRQFDFNEPENPDRLPQFWEQIKNAHFPGWNISGFEPEHPLPDQPNRHIRIPTRGGNAGVRLASGVIPVIPETDYHVAAKVRTDGLHWSRARLLAYFLDTEGRPLTHTQVRSDPIVTDGVWRDVEVSLRADQGMPAEHEGTPSAAWIVIELRLDQPSLWRDAGESADGAVNFEDVQGASASFDDLIVWRVPRIELAASERGFTADPGGVTLTLRVRDIAQSALTAEATVRDLTGAPVDVAQLAVRSDADPLAWKPRLPAYGWYRASVEVREGSRRIGEAATDFVWLPPRDASAHDLLYEGFGVVADEWPHALWDDLPRLLDELGADEVTVALWPAAIPLSEMRAHRQRVEKQLSPIAGAGRDVNLAITTLPDQLANQLQVDPSMVLQTLGRNDERAWGQLEEFLVGLGQSARRWQIGPTVVVDFHRQPDGPARLVAIADRLNRLLAHRAVVVPWSIDMPWMDELPTSLTQPDEPLPPVEAEPLADEPANTSDDDPEASSYESPPVAPRESEPPLRFLAWLPQAALPETIGEYWAAWEGAAPAGRAVILETASPELFGLPHTVADLLKRAILAREAGVEQLLIEHPWRVGDPLRPAAAPTVLFPVWRNLASHLARRRPVARLDLGEGIVAIVFQDARGEGGTVAVWNDSPTAEEATARVFLGNREIGVTDAFGNRTPVLPLDGEHRFTVGGTPVFVDDADINLALFRAGFRVEPRFVEGSAAVHQHELVLANPWRSNVAGALRILEPADWDIKQRVRTFTLPAGEELRLPVVFTYPASEAAGEKRFVLELDLQTDRTTTVRVEAPVELGFRKVTLEPRYQIARGEGGAEELVVTHEITNNSDAPVWLTAYTVIDGYGRSEADVANLEPGETTVRIFRFPDPSRRMLDRVARVGLREKGGPGRINLMLPIEP